MNLRTAFGFSFVVAIGCGGALPPTDTTSPSSTTPSQSTTPNADGGTTTASNDGSPTSTAFPIDISLWTDPVHDLDYQDTKLYSSAMDPSTNDNGQPSRILQSTSDAVGSNDCGYVYYDLSPAQWLGKRLRLRADMKSELTTGTLGLDFGVYDANGNATAADDMSNRLVTGTTDWATYADVLDVAANAATIEIGYHVCAAGKAWISNVRFDVVDDSVASTQLYPAS